MREFITKHSNRITLLATIGAIIFVLSYAGYLHFTNHTMFPYYESDEGTYTSQAWSVINEGALSPYTYWYDHPPVGWFVIAIWYSLLSESYFTFGTSIDTARVLMSALFMVNVLLVFEISRRLTKSITIPTLVTILYASSPLIIYFSRRVLLDNIQVPLLLLSVFLLTTKNKSLRLYAASGAIFALAFLTKITAVMFLLPMAFLLFFMKDEVHRVFRIGAWFSAAGVVTSLYFLFALIKNEFFPAPADTSEPHVSFIETLTFQMSRGESLPFYHPDSDFLAALAEWVSRDFYFVLIAIATLILGTLFALWRRKNVFLQFFVLACLFYILFLIRGGLVINFYLLPLAPFLVILIALLLSEVAELAKRYSGFNKTTATITGYVLSITFVALSVIALLHYNVVVDQRYLYVDETTNQKEALHWVKENLPEGSDIIIDVAMYVELHDPQYLNNKVFNNAEWFYKVSRDPVIRYNKFNDDWRNFDYIVLTHEMLKQVNTFPEYDIVRQAFDNALPIAKWFENSTSFIDEQRRITTNGDWAMVYDVNSQTREQLADAWEKYKQDFIFSYGQVIDPSGDVTTSEGQSYAMLRAVWMNDHDTFKGVWAWTQHHLQHRLEDSLISWKWVDGELVDPANATDADIDIALALLFAYKTFGEEQYLIDATEIIRDIWRQSVIEIDGRYYLVSSNVSHGQVPEGLLFNPSYMSPAHYRIFAEVDPDNDWNKLADDTYGIIEKLTAGYRTPLVKNWYVINPETGNLFDASPYIGVSANHSSYDAFRVYWRVWLDYVWFNTEEAQSYLRRTGRYFSQYADANVVPTIINPVTGEIISTQESLAITSSYVLPMLLLDDKSIARSYYEKQLGGRYDEAGYWGYETVYYDQNWAWFTSAFYNQDLHNIWNLEITFSEEGEAGIRF